MRLMVLYGTAPTEIATAGRLTCPPIRPAVAADAPLACLAGGALAPRFHAWRGRSGKRYVCSVFPASPAETAGLPDYPGAIAIAARRDGEARELLGLFTLTGDIADKVQAARAAGVQEWHLHLLAETSDEQAAMVADFKVPAVRRLAHIQGRSADVLSS